MKSFFYVLLVAVAMFAACNSSKKQNVTPGATPQTTESTTPVVVNVELLEGYFLKNTYKFNDSIELIVANDSAAFETTFGMAKTMNNTIKRPNFKTQSVAAIIMQATPFKTEMKVDKVEMLNNVITAYVTIAKGEKQTYTSTPMLLSVFSKQESAGKQLKVVINGVPNERLTQTL